jgi:hypothetical protein
MRLRALRHRGAAFDARFHQKHPLFWPLARAAAAFAEERDWPEVASYARAFAGEPVVRFEAARPVARRARRTAPVDGDALYDARITREACVPTRVGSWHDFLNALVWATFPRAKGALHRRQHEELSARLVPGARTLPPTRSRVHDALALLDEGGVVVLDDGRRRLGVVFGHALYESLVLGVRAMAARAVEVRVEVVPADATACTALADAALEKRLSDPGLHPDALPRVALGELPAGPAGRNVAEELRAT